MSKGWQTSDEMPAVLIAREAAEYLRVSPPTIIRLAKKGIIPGAKVGWEWRFSKETILNLLKHPEFIRR